MDPYTPSYNSDRAARDQTALLVALAVMVVAALVVILEIAPSGSVTVSATGLVPKAVSEVRQPVLALAGGFPGVLVSPGEGSMRQIGGGAPVEFVEVPPQSGVMLQTEVGVWVAPRGAANEILLVRNAVGAAPGVQPVALPPTVAGAEVRALAAGLGRLWIGTSRGLLTYDWGRFNPYTPPTRSTLGKSAPNNLDVRALYLDHAGTLWVGTFDGLYSYNGTEMFRHTVKEGLPDNSITAITGDSSGILIVGTERGLATFDRGVWVRQGEITALVTAVLAADDQIYVGTNNGLHQRLEGRWTRITGTPELPLPASVSSLAWGPDGVYVGTTQGLYKLVAAAADPKDTKHAEEVRPTEARTEHHAPAGAAPAAPAAGHH